MEDIRPEICVQSQVVTEIMQPQHFIDNKESTTPESLFQQLGAEKGLKEIVTQVILISSLHNVKIFQDKYLLDDITDV